MSLNEILAAQAALELARAKAAKLLKEIEYTKNRYTRAEEAAAEAQREVNRLKAAMGQVELPAAPAPQPEPAAQPVEEPKPLTKAERRAQRKAETATTAAKVA